MVVSGGRAARAALLSSNPTTAMSSGTRRLGVVQRDQRTLRHEVVGREHAIEVVVLGEQSLHRRLAAVVGEVALDRRHVGHPVTGHGLAEAGDAVVAGGYVDRTSDHRDVLAPSGEEVFGGQGGSRVVGQVHEGDGVGAPAVR